MLLAGNIWAWMFMKVVTWRVRGASPFFPDKGNGVGSGYVLVSTQEAHAGMWICLFVLAHVSSRTWCVLVNWRVFLEFFCSCQGPFLSAWVLEVVLCHVAWCWRGAAKI